MARDVHDALALPVDDRATTLATLPEDQWFDRKSPRVRARDLADVLIGMANAEGGTVVIGIEDGAVVGVSGSGERLNAWRQAPVDFTLPPVPARFRSVECRNDHGDRDELLVVEIDPSDRVHRNPKDEVYLRIGDETRRLTFDQRRELEFDKGQSNYETTATRTLERDDLDGGLLDDLSRRLGHPDPDRVLIARGLMQPDGAISIGGALLFARSPQAEFPEAHVRVLRYRGTERGSGRRQQVEEDVRIDGPLPTQIEEAHRVVASITPTRRALSSDGTFTNVGAVPRDAWLEGVVNAVTHRSYSMAGDHIRVEVFDDRIEIESPGRFPGVVDPSSPESITRFARNPRIARVLADLDFGQELGEGIRRMFEEMRLAGLAEPIYRQTAGSVHLTLLAEPVDRELDRRLPPLARTLVRTIREAERASTGDLVDAVDKSRPVVLRALRALREEGLVEWVGSSKRDPRAYWRLPR